MRGEGVERLWCVPTFMMQMTVAAKSRRYGWMPQRTQSQLGRLLELIAFLRVRAAKPGELASTFHVTTRTVHRDLATVDALSIGLERDTGGRYRLPAEPTRFGPTESLALHAAGRLLHHHAPDGIDAYRTALSVLVSALPRAVQDEARRAIGVTIKRDSALERTFEVVARAWVERRVMRFRYRRANEILTEARLVEVRFVEVNPRNLAMYVVGTDRRRDGAVRTFKLARIEQAHLDAETFPSDASFDPSKSFTGALGVFGSATGETRSIIVRVVPGAVMRFREDPPHVTTAQERSDDGSLVVTFDVAAGTDGMPLELLSYIRSWGAEMQVLAPSDVRRRWIEDARAVLAAAEHTPTEGVAVVHES